MSTQALSDLQFYLKQSNVTYTDVYQKYVIENLLIKDLANIYKVTRYKIAQVLDYFEIKRKENSDYQLSGYSRRSVSKETRQKMSKAGMGHTNAKGHVVSLETRKYMSEIKQGNKHNRFGKTHSRETKLKMRQARIAHIKKQEGSAKCFFNIEACKYFKEFDNRNVTKGLYGKEEFYIKELGYFLDYKNDNLKLIIEWNEKQHYVVDKLRPRDIIRNKEIKQMYSDYKYIIIKDSEIKTYTDFQKKVGI